MRGLTKKRRKHFAAVDMAEHAFLPAWCAIDMNTLILPTVKRISPKRVREMLEVQENIVQRTHVFLLELRSINDFVLQRDKIYQETVPFKSSKRALQKSLEREHFPKNVEGSMFDCLARSVADRKLSGRKSGRRLVHSGRTAVSARGTLDLSRIVLISEGGDLTP